MNAMARAMGVGSIVLSAVTLPFLGPFALIPAAGGIALDGVWQKGSRPFKAVTKATPGRHFDSFRSRVARPRTADRFRYFGVSRGRDDFDFLLREGGYYPEFTLIHSRPHGAEEVSIDSILIELPVLAQKALNAVMLPTAKFAIWLGKKYGQPDAFTGKMPPPRRLQPKKLMRRNKRGQGANLSDCE